MVIKKTTKKPTNKTKVSSTKSPKAASAPKKRVPAKSASAKRNSAKKSPAKKSAKKTSNKKSPIRSFIKSFLWRFFALAFIAFLVLVLYLDLLVTNKFEGQKWALPAHVYTRAMDVYVGQVIPQKDIAAELRELGYKDMSGASDVSKTGEFLIKGNQLFVYQRSFNFGDGARAARKVRVAWQADQIRRIYSEGEMLGDVKLGITELDIIRVEPRLFGSVSPISHEDRSLITLADTPQELIDALLVMEDRKFHKHWGVDPLGIARAMVRNVRAGRTVQGGSTLTQQLVKNYFLTPDRTIKRKLTEMIMAFLLELHYSKDAILQAYLNEVNLGQSGNRAIHGFGLGSEFLYGRPLSELDVHQMAMMAGMVKGPSSYNPVKNPERAKKRRDLVLTVMAEQGFISNKLAESEKLKPLDTIGSSKKQALRSYPAFTGFVRSQLTESYQTKDLTEEGLSIFTTLDPRAQSSLDEAVELTLAELNKSKPQHADQLQVAAISVRTDNGEVLAISGGRGIIAGGFNRALQAKRPIGSLIKPFVLAAAIRKNPEKYQLGSMVVDDEVTIKQQGSEDWKPQNYDNKVHGNIMLMDALARSYNLPFVRMGMDVGIDAVIDTLQDYGLNDKPKARPSLLLGSLEITPLEVSQLYLTMASGGFKTPLTAVNAVLDIDKQPLDRFELKLEQVVPVDVNNLVTHGMQETMRTGTGRGINSQFSPTLSLAGKTGTTNDYKDSWFVGFSGNVLTVVWMGRDDNKPSGLTGSSGAGRLWTNYMSKIQLMPLRPLFIGDVEYVESPSYVKQEDSTLEYTCNSSRLVPVIQHSDALMVCGDTDKYGWGSHKKFNRMQKERSVGKIGRFFGRIFR